MIFTDSLLDKKRQNVDNLADIVVKNIFESPDAQSINKLVASVSVNNESVSDGLPDVVKNYFEETNLLPDFADKKLLKKGSEFFARNAQAIMSVLGYYALPYCYAAADGAQVLYLSQKIRNNTVQRLTETGQFVLDVMHPKSFEKEGKGIRSMQKVRLMHATVRYHILKRNQWNSAWGMPVNQEDMLGTNLAFSFITLRGLDKLGIHYSQEEAESFLHLWKVIGAGMGVETDLLPDTLKQAYDLDKKISQRHFRRSEAGVSLTQALIYAFKELIPNPVFHTLIPSYLRFMLGKEIADLLEVPESRSSIADNLWFTGIKTINALGSNLGYVSDASGVIHALILQLQKQNAAIADFQLPEKTA
jgi:hypothetical protein